MDRRAVCCLGLVIGLFVATGPVAAQTVDALLAANLRARGGQAAIDAVHSVRQTSTLSMQGGEATVVVHASRPNRIRQEMSVAGQTVINAFDGRVAWVVNPLVGMRAPTVVTGAQAEAIERQAGFDGPLQAAREAGRRIEFMGIGTYAGRQVYHLRISSTDGHAVEHCYVDVVTWLEVALVTQTEIGWFEQEFADYRDVEGLAVPFLIRTRLNGRPQSEVTVTEVALNVPVDPASFSPPAPTP